MDVIIDDLTGNQVPKESAWKIKIVQPDKLTLEIDAIPQEQIQNLISMAKQHGQKWFYWKNNVGSDGKVIPNTLHKQYPDEANLEQGGD